MVVLLHIAFLITFLALSIRDVLFLRIILCVANALQVVHKTHSGLSIGREEDIYIALWNALFLTINIIQVIKTLRERSPIKIPNEIDDIYKTKFSNMTPREFIYFWSLGKQGEVEDKQIIKEGDYQKSLFLILSGNAQVSRDGRVIAALHRPEFVGEISFITKEPASADVFAKSKMYYIQWDQEELRKLKISNSSFWTKLNQILGEDLARKIKHNSIIKTEETQKAEQK